MHWKAHVNGYKSVEWFSLVDVMFKPDLFVFVIIHLTKLICILSFQFQGIPDTAIIWHGIQKNLIL